MEHIRNSGYEKTDFDKDDTCDCVGDCGNSNSNTALELSKRGYKKIIILLIAFLFILMFRTIVLERTIVNGNSMNPTLSDGDICFTRKFDVEPTRYDIVIARIEGKTIIKRVVGLPGDTLVVKNGSLYINGVLVPPEYDFYTGEAGVLSDEYIVGENEYFLLGDNRGGSYDSRYIGSVEKGDINGVVICRFFPFNKIEF